MKRTFILTLLLIFVSCSVGDAQQDRRGSGRSRGPRATSQRSDKVSKADAEKLIGHLRGSKTRIAGGKDLLKDTYKNNDRNADFVAARKLYIDAHSAYDEFLGTLLEAIRDGNEKNLLNDSEFQATGEKAKKLASRFLEKVDERTSERTSEAATGWPVPDLEDMVGSAINIWKAWKDDKRTKRNAKADRLQNELSWDPWNPSSAPSPSPRATPTPTC